MASHWIGDKSLFEPMLTIIWTNVDFTDAYMMHGGGGGGGGGGWMS